MARQRRARDTNPIRRGLQAIRGVGRAVRSIVGRFRGRQATAAETRKVLQQGRRVGTTGRTGPVALFLRRGVGTRGGATGKSGDRS